MAQQTALEQLIEWIDSDCTPMDCVMKAKELLKVERQQKKYFFDCGRQYQLTGDGTFTQVYTQTYGK